MWPLYQKLRVLPLNILIQIEQAKTMYKFEHKLLPQVFEKYFSKPSHQYATRYATTQSNFEVVRISSAKEKSLLKYYGPKVWASIPLLIKNLQSLKVFIHSYRNHLIGNYAEYFVWTEVFFVTSFFTKPYPPLTIIYYILQPFNWHTCIFFFGFWLCESWDFIA